MQCQRKPGSVRAGHVFPDLEPGDPLAVSFTINLDVSDIDSFQNISSIMKVTSHKDKEMKVNNDKMSFISICQKRYISNMFGIKIFPISP